MRRSICKGRSGARLINFPSSRLNLWLKLLLNFWHRIVHNRNWPWLKRKWLRKRYFFRFLQNFILYRVLLYIFGTWSILFPKNRVTTGYTTVILIFYAFLNFITYNCRSLKRSKKKQEKSKMGEITNKIKIIKWLKHFKEERKEKQETQKRKKN